MTKLTAKEFVQAEIDREQVAQKLIELAKQQGLQSGQGGMTTGSEAVRLQAELSRLMRVTDNHPNVSYDRMQKLLSAERAVRGFAGVQF